VRIVASRSLIRGPDNGFEEGSGDVGGGSGGLTVTCIRPSRGMPGFVMGFVVNKVRRTCRYM
jgi:hypothetical protein